MKKRLIALAAALLLLAGCGAKDSLEGVWEYEATVNVLGVGIEEPTRRTDIQRFEFREDGTGVITSEFGDDYPNPPDIHFHYTLEGDTLTIVRDDGGSDMVFAVTLDGDALKLEKSRGTFDLKRVS